MAAHREPGAGYPIPAARGGGSPTHPASSQARPGRGLRPSEGRVAAINQALIVLPAIVTLLLILEYSSAHQIAIDFQHDFWVAGLRVRHGLSPYNWSRRQISEGGAFPYPATAALVFVPFSLVSRALGSALFVAVSLIGCVSTLRILNVRDWRPYTLVLLWLPVITGWQTANVTLLLVCGVAAVWRYRDSPAAAAVISALMLSIKPVVWPLMLWFLVTRRFRAAAYALALALVLNLVSWAVLGFGQLSIWWHLLATQTDVLYRQAYGLTALAVHLGAGRTGGTALQLVATAALVLTCVRLARNGRDRGSFVLAVALMVVSSPLVDNHYFAVLLVPLAIARPYLSRAWLAPLVLWLCPATVTAGWQPALAWVTLGVITVWVIRDGEPPGETLIASAQTRASGPLTDDKRLSMGRVMQRNLSSGDLDVA